MATSGFPQPLGQMGSPPRLIRLALLTSALMVLLLVAASRPSPHLVLLPGQVLELGPKIHLPADKQRDTGWLALTTIRIARTNYAGWLRAQFDPNALVPVAGNSSSESVGAEYRTFEAAAMEGSKAVATLVALRYAGYPAEIGGQGLLVEAVPRSGAGAGQLNPGDVILSLEGHAITTVDQLATLARQSSRGGELQLEVLRDRQRLTITLLAPAPSSEQGWPLPGVEVSAFVYDVALPFAIELDTTGLLGPSTGLMLGLGLLDAMTTGDLAAGQRVAGTGTLDLDGRVGPIGGVARKVTAAERQGAEIFISPRENADEASRTARRARVIPVGTFEEALAALRQLGGGLAP
jgi:PDZ domain-containing protein